MRTPITGPIQLSVADVTSERIVSLYLFGEVTPPANLYDRLKPANFAKVSVVLDATELMTVGAGGRG